MPCMLAAHVIPPHFSRILATGLFSLLSVISVCTLVILLTQASWFTDVLPYNDLVLKVPHQRPSWMEESTPNQSPAVHSQTTVSHSHSFLWYLTPGTLRFPGYCNPLIRPPFHCPHPYVFHCSRLDSQIHNYNHSLILHASVLNPALLLHAAPVNCMWLQKNSQLHWCASFTFMILLLFDNHSICHHPVTLRFSRQLFPTCLFPESSAPYLIPSFTWIESCFLPYWVHRSDVKSISSIPSSLLPTKQHLRPHTLPSCWSPQWPCHVPTKGWLFLLYLGTRFHLLSPIQGRPSNDSPVSLLHHEFLPAAESFASAGTQTSFSPISKTFFGTTFSTSHHPVSLEQNVKGHIYLLVSLSSAWIFS